MCKSINTIIVGRHTKNKSHKCGSTFYITKEYRHREIGNCPFFIVEA